MKSEREMSVWAEEAAEDRDLDRAINVIGFGLAALSGAIAYAILREVAVPGVIMLAGWL